MNNKQVNKGDAVGCYGYTAQLEVLGDPRKVPGGWVVKITDGHCVWDEPVANLSRKGGVR